MSDPRPPSTAIDSVPQPIIPSDRELCTPALQRFLRRHFDIFDLFFFSLSLAQQVDSSRVIAARALASSGNPSDAERLAKIEQDPTPATDRIIHFRTLQAENICIRSVDNFLSFLSEIIQDVMLRKPEMLRSEDPVTLEDVLRFRRYSDLIPYLVDKKMNALAYGGIQGIEKFVRTRTGLELFDTPEQKTLLMLAVELRNNYSHNRGRVTETTLRRLTDLPHGFDLVRGQSPVLIYDDWIMLCNNLVVVARRLDKLFAGKFSIRRKRYRPRLLSKDNIKQAVIRTADEAAKRRSQTA